MVVRRFSELKHGAALSPASPRTASDRWHLDEVFIRIGDKTNYLWRAVDDEGEVPAKRCALQLR